MVFALKDKYTGFSVDLETVIECLRLAESSGFVPKIQKKWWCGVEKKLADRPSDGIIMDKIFENRARLCHEPLHPLLSCEACYETLTFDFFDNCHEFSVSLTNILHMLAVAEQENAVPPLPDKWWWMLHQ